jgi:uroporphyrinogen decarboxylase
MPLKNDRLIKALLRQPVDKTPVWIMRQAGRYLPEYRAVREQAGSFMALCKNPELACQVTLQPLQRFSLDAAILFSDILTIPDAMGLGLHFIEGEGPTFERPITTLRDIQQCPIPDPEMELSYVMDAIRLIKKNLHGQCPLIGFAGSPWTIASYMVEGRSSRSFSQVKTLLYTAPSTLHRLLAKLAQSITDYLNAQIRAGVDVVMLFDTWGGCLTTNAYMDFSLLYMQQIIQGLHTQREGQTIPVIVFTKHGNLWLEAMADSGCDAVGVDWTIDLGEARRRIGDKVALQGNLDPAILYASPEVIRQQVQQVLQQFGTGSGHVFNLGHGITPDILPEHVNILVDAVHEFS